MATLQAATTRNHHTELFNGILYQYLQIHTSKRGWSGQKGLQRSTAGKLSAKQMAELTVWTNANWLDKSHPS